MEVVLNKIMGKYTGNSKWVKCNDSPLHQETLGNNKKIPTETNANGESQTDIFLKRRSAVNEARKGLRGFEDRMEDANRNTVGEINAISKEKSLYKKILRKKEDAFEYSKDSMDIANLKPIKLKTKK